MFSKSPDQIWQGPEGGLKLNAVHEQLRRQPFSQSFFMDAGYEEAKSSGKVTPRSMNPSVLPFIASHLNGLFRTQPLDAQSCESWEQFSVGLKTFRQLQS